MNKRLSMLEQMTAAGNADSFAWYALALEYKKEQRVDDALRTFEALRERDAGYLPMYLMAGQLLVAEGRGAEAKAWLEPGIALAKQKDDNKALVELTETLEQI